MQLFLYELCPFCNQVETLLGLKAMDVAKVCLPYDDEKTPKSMVGKKSLPILDKGKEVYMAESIDIIRYIDTLGGPILRHEVKSGKEFKAKGAFLEFALSPHSPWKCLYFPRAVLMPFPEFPTEAARVYFKDQKEKVVGPFEELLKKTSSYVTSVQEALEPLEKVFTHPYGAGDTMHLHLSHIQLFSFLRTLTLVKGLKLPKKLNRFAEETSKQARLELYTTRAF